VIVQAGRDIGEPARFGGRWEHSGQIAVLRADLEAGAHQEQAADLLRHAAGQPCRELAAVGPADHQEALVPQPRADGRDDLVQHGVRARFSRQ
jgi:hypothetical protein